MNPQHLLEQAELLATADPTRPRAANLRRAVSASYYAVFHHLTRAVAVRQIGAGPDRRAFADVLARGVDHGDLRAICKDFMVGLGGWRAWMREELAARSFTIPPALADACGDFLELQRLRHLADYAPSYRLDREDALAEVSRAREAIAAFTAAEQTDAGRFFLAAAPLWKGLRQRG